VRLTREQAQQLARRGVSVEEALRQLDLLSRPGLSLTLDRPCTPGDGILRLDDAELPRLRALHAEAAAAGRFVKFVPASGAASRMFAALEHFLRGAGRGLAWEDVLRRAEGGSSRAAELVAFVEGLRRLPFAADLDAEVRRRGGDLDRLAASGDFRPILRALLDADGLDYGRRPKGLLPFHRGADGAVRTALEEHFAEAAHHVRDGEGRCRMHFTVSPEHLGAFEDHVRAVAADHERRLGIRLHVEFSVQRPSTDTLALDGDGPALDARGALRFRPGGHGALIENLDALRADLVFIKNVDNVQPDSRRAATLAWKPVLAGLLVELQREAHGHLGRLQRPGSRDDVRAAAEFLVQRLGAAAIEGGDARRRILERLDRPMRVCGVVPVSGEPGGGPFWVRGRDGSVERQIVEAAQVDPSDAAQRRILEASTHFNPVDLVCAVRDREGRPRDLRGFVDRDAVIVSEKLEGGRKLRVLELPGLWNGGMGRWNTVFVEVPLATFSPVKTIADLLREEHG
jgi:hypothetical protein